MPDRTAAGVVQELRIQLLGEFRIRVGERVIIASQFKLRKARNLIKLLALADGHHLHREQIAELLWPEHTPPAACLKPRIFWQAASHPQASYRQCRSPEGDSITTCRFS